MPQLFTLHKKQLSEAALYKSCLLFGRQSPITSNHLCMRLFQRCASCQIYVRFLELVSKTTHIYGVDTVILAGKSLDIRSYAVYTYSSGQPYKSPLFTRQESDLFPLFAFCCSFPALHPACQAAYASYPWPI